MNKITYPNMTMQPNAAMVPPEEIKQMFQTAVNMHRAGQIPQAEQVCRKILSVDPKNVNVLHLLGMIGVQIGQFAPAVEILKRANKYQPDNPDICNTLGMALQQNGNLEEAAKSFQNAVKLNPDSTPLLNNLGLSYLAQKKLDNAKASFEKALDIKPEHPETLLNLGGVMQLLGSFEKAEELFKKVIEFRPDLITAYINLGAVYKEQEKYDEALKVLNRAGELQPGNVDIQYNLGTVYQQNEDLDEARAAFEKVLQQQSNNIHAYNNLGLIYQKQKKVQKAEDCFRKALNIDPEFPESLNNLGLLLSQIGKYKESLDLLGKAANIRPDYINTLRNLGTIYEEKGEGEEAVSLYKKMLADIPESQTELTLKITRIMQNMGMFKEAEEFHDDKMEINPREKIISTFLNHVATNKIDSSNDANINEIEKILAEGKINENQETSIKFALGKAYDDCKEYEKAFGYYKQANKNVRATINYTKEEFSKEINEYINLFTTSFYNSIDYNRNTTQRPVFIVGMPRSGTTLTEQIISSHPMVYGAGELRHLHRIANDLKISSSEQGKKYPGCLNDYSESDYKKVTGQYLEILEDLNKDALRVTDKLPGNFINVGLIAFLYPAASIIHCRRHPLDTCLSIYTKHFSGEHPYAYDLEDLGHYYKEYSRLMTHWNQVLPGKIYNLDYEELVTNTEKQSRALIDFIGLEWDPVCLEYYQSNRSVRTISNWQVRQPIYSSSKARWKPYKKHLAPLIETIGSDILNKFQ